MRGRQDRAIRGLRAACSVPSGFWFIVGLFGACLIDHYLDRFLLAGPTGDRHSEGSVTLSLY